MLSRTLTDETSSSCEDVIVSASNLLSDREIKWWCEKMQILESQVQSTQKELKQSRTEVGSLQLKLREEREFQQTTTRKALQEQKGRKELEGQLKEISEQLSAETEKQQSLEKDKKSLCRTISRLKESLCQSQMSSILAKEQVNEIDGQKTQVESVKKTMKAQIDNLSNLNGTMADELSAERDKRQRLKTQIRAKLEKVEAQHRLWCNAMERHQLSIQDWSQKLNEAEQRIAAAEKQTELSRKQTEKARVEAEEQRIQKEQVHTQLRELQQTNCALVEQLITRAREPRESR
eukprot:GHVQ01032085.1.p1 GENE.GHVQ01032085.1~~GHVQ01032085.1.p1  ORF type:complete len:291 (-),score=54.66 GHVQ01032085.1:158-1030(-)